MLKTLKNKTPKFKILKICIKDFICQQLWVYLIVFASIMLCAWIFNRWIEGFMFCVAHTCIRNAFNKQFHFNKTAYCLILTCTIIWFSIPITLPLATSLLSSIPVAFLVCFFGFIAQDRVDLLLYKKKHESFNLKTCTKEELIHRCDLLGYNKDKTELAIMLFIDKLSHYQIWNKLCEEHKNIDIATIKQYKYRIKKELLKYKEQ